MSFLDRLFGRKPAANVLQPANQERSFSHYEQPLQDKPTPQQPTDVQALERYRYMLKTAPPDQIELAHAEAFAALTPEQRALALQQLSQALPDSERQAYTTDDPRTLARMATRAEMRRPGTVERSFGGGVGGMGMGGMVAGSLMSSLAGAFIGTAIANQFFNESTDFGTDQDASTEQDTTQEQETGLEDGGDFGGGDFGGGDFGGGDF